MKQLTSTEPVTAVTAEVMTPAEFLSIPIGADKIRYVDGNDLIRRGVVSVYLDEATVQTNRETDPLWGTVFHMHDQPDEFGYQVWRVMYGCIGPAIRWEGNEAVHPMGYSALGEIDFYLLDEDTPLLVVWKG